jgi:hypothetical protein
LGKALRETGHSRVPEPPHKMTEWITANLFSGRWPGFRLLSTERHERRRRCLVVPCFSLKTTMFRYH